MTYEFHQTMLKLIKYVTRSEVGKLIGWQLYSMKSNYHE